MQGFFEHFKKLNADFCMQTKVICSDMWKPYLKVISEESPHAINVLDRFHIMQKFGKAIDEVRAGRSQAIERKRERYCLRGKVRRFRRKAKDISDQRFSDK